MAIISLVYVSVSAHNLTDEELKEILEVSRQNNQALEITGMLLYRDGYFLQALEGEESTVMPLYERIRADDRHRRVLLIHKTTVQQRSFPDWSMGFNKISDEEAEALPGFTNFLQDPSDHTYFSQNPGRAVKLLESFKNRVYF
jgi:hypothetical protein